MTDLVKAPDVNGDVLTFNSGQVNAVVAKARGAARTGRAIGVLELDITPDHVFTIDPFVDPGTTIPPGLPLMNFYQTRRYYILIRGFEIGGADLTGHARVQGTLSAALVAILLCGRATVGGDVSNLAAIWRERMPAEHCGTSHSGKDVFMPWEQKVTVHSFPEGASFTVYGITMSSTNDLGSGDEHNGGSLTRVPSPGGRRLRAPRQALAVCATRIAPLSLSFVDAYLDIDESSRTATVTVTGLRRPFAERVDLAPWLESSQR